MTDNLTEDLTTRGEEFPGTGMIRYVIPLGQERTAELILPRDLREAEVGRLLHFLNTLVDPYRNVELRSETTDASIFYRGQNANESHNS